MHLVSFPMTDRVASVGLLLYDSRIFLAFSNFMEMHGLMANYRVGVLTMKVIHISISSLAVSLRAFSVGDFVHSSGSVCLPVCLSV
jgi:Kinesin-associated protein (KAP)